MADTYKVKVKLIHWPTNDEAPFDFDFHENIEVIDKSSLTETVLIKKCNDFGPKIIYVSGWVDDVYRKIALAFRKNKIPVILGNDNPWKGNVRQRIACLISPLYIKPYYSHTWIPGRRQYEYSRRLDFKEKNILQGVYCADTSLFRNEEDQERTLAKTILYAGRFLNWKGVKELYQAFCELQRESSNEWKLLMIGRGPLRDDFKSELGVEIRDFIQPVELRKIMQNVGVFCLPSYEEHWGVAVHEATAAGCPLLLSDGVGAGSVFIRNGYNGFVFKSKNKSALKNALEKMINTSDEDRKKMSLNSIKLSKQITPHLWAATLMSIC